MFGLNLLKKELFFTYSVIFKRITFEFINLLQGNSSLFQRRRTFVFRMPSGIKKCSD